MIVGQRRIERFWSRVDVKGPDECWLWLGHCKARGGYGSSSLNDHTITAHRLAYLIANGELPSLVRHTCDVPRCCNPRHLLAGTPADNMADKVARGRQARGDRLRGFPVQAREWTHCRNGHEFTEANTRLDKRGCRTCRACAREKRRRGKQVQR